MMHRQAAWRPTLVPHLGTYIRPRQSRGFCKPRVDIRAARVRLYPATAPATGRPARFFGRVRPRGSAARLRFRLRWPRDSAPKPRRQTQRISRRRAGRRRRKRDERGRSAQRRPPSELPLNKTTLRTATVSTSSAPQAPDTAKLHPRNLIKARLPCSQSELADSKIVTK
jgi:hypothetical protein